VPGSWRLEQRWRWPTYLPWCVARFAEWRCWLEQPQAAYECDPVVVSCAISKSACRVGGQILRHGLGTETGAAMCGR
jgi:hypothetical protein